MTNMIIVGGGKGGFALLRLLKDEGAVKLLGLVDADDSAPGVKLARELGVPVAARVSSLVNGEKIDQIINTTGSNRIQMELLEARPKGAEIIGGEGGRFMWIVLQRCVLAEEKAKNEGKFRQALLGAIPFGMDIVDEHGTVLFANTLLRKALGDDMVGKKCWELYKDDKIQCAECPRKKTIQIGETKTIENDGVLGGKCVQITHTGMIYGGRKAILEIFEDITARKRAEQEVKKTVETREGFISMVSHELRTPLTAIKESMEIILEGIAGEINARQKQFLEIGSRNVDRLARLINDVLDLQKLEAGKEHFKIKDNDLRGAAQEVLAAMKPLAESRGLELALHWTDDLPGVKFDRDKLIQVLTNLLNNSLKFTEKGGVTLKLEKVDSVVRISVEDTGPGIAKNDIPKLFQRFAQVGKAKEMTGGTGLGLVICKRIIARHGGRIWAESQLGEGTSVRFTLPLGGREKAS